MKVRRILAMLSGLALCFAFCGCSAPAIYRNDELYGVAAHSSEHLGSVLRSLPEVKDGGLDRYPQYGTELSKASEAEKQAILDENKAFFDYDKVDADGGLSKGGVSVGKLFKHSAADGLYGGNIADDAPAVAKRIRIDPSTYGNNITGLYVPPGEVVTIVMDETAASRGMYADIGQCTQRGGVNIIPVTRAYTRMPSLKKRLKLNSVENYVGSPLGGPLYIFNESDAVMRGQPYEITVIGAVEMPVYVLGGTSEEEWEELRNAPAPLFDLETFGGVRLTMPAKFVRDMSGAEMKRIAEFWDKSAQLGNRMSGGAWFSDHPVTMCYDTHIPAGAAVAIVGADACYLPIDWAKNALNYTQLMTSGGWGNLHELNHHHQGWGAGDNGEVTNNVINAMIYSLHTNVAASRTEGGGLTGWNWVSDAYYTLKRTVDKQTSGGKNRDLSMYVDIFHAFGADVMIEIAQNSRANNENAFYMAAVNATGCDMTYYLRDVCGLDISEDLTALVAERGLPVFVPIAGLYQSGRYTTSMKNGVAETSLTETGKAFYIPFGQDKVLDFAQYTVCPNGIEFRIEEVSSPSEGKLTAYEENGETVYGKYVYTPNKKSSQADTFTVRYSLRSVSDSDMEIEDVTVKITLIQDVSGVSAEIWQNPGYTDLGSAIEDNFASDKRVVKLEDTAYGYAGSSDSRKNTITKLTGKIVAPASGTYALFIKGGDAVRLYAGADRAKLSLSAEITQTQKIYSVENESSYFTAALTAGSPLYFEMYVLGGGGKSFSGIGWADITQQQGTGSFVQDENGNITGGGSDTSTAVPIVDIPAAYIYHADANIATPARSDYESDRVYVKEHTASGTVAADISGASVSGPQMYGSYKLESMLDGDKSTFCHTRVGEFPLEFVFDFKQQKTFNSMVFTYRADGRGRIKQYELYAGNSPLDFVDGAGLIAEGELANSARAVAEFDNLTARYVKLVVYSAYPSNNQYYVAMSTVTIGTSIQNAAIAPHTGSDIVYSGSWAENRFGGFFNGGAYETDRGSMEVTFHGTDFGLFAATGRKYGTGEIRIDGGEWQTVNFYSDTDNYGQLLFAATGLADGYHKVELRASSLVNVDYIAVKPTTPPQDTGLGGWWVAVGIAIAAACVALGVAGYFLGKFLSDKGVIKKRARKQKPISPPSSAAAVRSAPTQSLLFEGDRNSASGQSSAFSSAGVNVPMAVQNAAVEEVDYGEVKFVGLMRERTRTADKNIDGDKKTAEKKTTSDKKAAADKKTAVGKKAATDKRAAESGKVTADKKAETKVRNTPAARTAKKPDVSGKGDSTKKRGGKQQ